MQRGRAGRDDPFGGQGDPFAGFGLRGDLMSNFFGGPDPFDDPFFTRPFGGMFSSDMFGPNRFGMFHSNMFGPSLFNRSMFGEPNNTGFIEAQPPQANNLRGPIIQELSSDDEEMQEGESGKEVRDAEGKKGRPNKEAFVQEPDEEVKERRRDLQYGTGYNGGEGRQTRTYSFQSSTVTYGGANGAYYTSSTTKRTVEESKEADTTTRKATHRVSRGIHDKGHSLTRKLNSDGGVETMQALHNLNEDELSGFNESWKRSAQRNFPGWNQGFDMVDDGNMRGGNTQQGQSSRGALPSIDQPQDSGRVRSVPSPIEQSQDPGRRARWAPPPTEQGRERSQNVGSGLRGSSD
ncbi:hypothetical protein QJS10_CPB20g01524 [Acorus calamus]|uniref:Glycine-rich protein n=1 Tax=Acorus calamus TaxID=4465 RepID=A0AAV9CAT0_ACOCL|nr:hypothetical protein QJS10_CPB20g01524 [Acorus calamus]